MPKESVFDAEQDIQFPIKAQVTWGRDSGTVQLATICSNDSSTLDEFNPGSNGWFVNLDRRGVNQVIRNLRKARDQAFGRDE